MKKISLTLLALACACYTVFAQSDTTHEQRMQWWREARFGLFIHWGVYSVPAGEYNGHTVPKASEWIMNRGKIPVATYQQYASEFNPVKYDADAWVRAAKDAGMKYIVITAKHHDGFAMFTTAASKWNIVDDTPYGKDVLKPLAAACKKYGIRLGFYYSQAQDWNNPGGAVSLKAASEGGAAVSDTTAVDAFTKANNGHWDAAQTTASMDAYIHQVALPQVKELLSNYGEVSVLWWDTPTNMTDAWAREFKQLLQLQPNIITNDRLKRPGFPGDYATPEQKIPKPHELDHVDWETCMTMNGSWGYKSSDNNWKSVQTLVRNLVDIASKGGNYLLNVGPTSAGEIPPQSIESLKAIGVWMKKNGEAIYGTHACSIDAPEWGRYTQKASGNNTILYASVFNWPANGQLQLNGISNAVIKATLLADGSTVTTSATATGLGIQLPSKTPDANATVIKIELKGNL